MVNLKLDFFFIIITKIIEVPNLSVSLPPARCCGWFIKCSTKAPVDLLVCAWPRHILIATCSDSKPHYRERDMVEPKVQSNGRVIAAAASPPVWPKLNPAYIGDHMRSVVVSKHCNHTTASHNHWMQYMAWVWVVALFLMGFVHWVLYIINASMLQCFSPSALHGPGYH